MSRMSNAYRRHIIRSITRLRFTDLPRAPVIQYHAARNETWPRGRLDATR
jgi:hypothetical protein